MIPDKMTINRYGRKFPASTTSLQIELTAYRHSFTEESGGLGRFQHFKNAYALRFPNLIKTYFSWTEEMLKAWCEEDRKGGGIVSAIGASGCGKSMTFGNIVHLDWLADPDNTVSLCASTTIKELNDRIWKYVRRSYSDMPFTVGKLLRSKPESIVSNNLEGGIYAVALQDDPDGESLKGFHPKRLRIIVDEGTAFSPAVLNLWENWTAAGKDFLLVVLSNFRGMDNLCAAVTEPVGGWHSVDYHNETKWKTKKGGTCILFDMLRNPVYLNPGLQPVLPFLKTKKELDLKIYGDGDNVGMGLEHPRVLQYIRSIPSFDDSAKTVLTPKIINAGGALMSPMYAGWGQEKLASLDPAFVSGGDECILQLGTLGYEKDGVQVLTFDETISLPLDSSSKVPTEYQILRLVVEECERRGIPPKNFVMDGCGSGRGLGSIFQHEWSDEIMVLLPSFAATDRIVGFDFDKKASQVYDRYVTELWWEFRKFVESSQIRSLDKVAASQFCQRLYDDSKLKLKLETKREYKARISGEESVNGSPDRADACVYLLELARSFGFELTARARKYADMVAVVTKTPQEEVVEEWVREREEAWIVYKTGGGSEGGYGAASEEDDYSDGDVFGDL